MFHKHKHTEQNLLEETVKEKGMRSQGPRKSCLFLEVAQPCLGKREVWVESEIDECLGVRQRVGGGTDG